MWLTKKDIDKGFKRVNLQLSIKMARKLGFISEKKSMGPGTLAKLYLVERVEKEYIVESKSTELPGQTSLFDKKRRK